MSLSCLKYSCPIKLKNWPKNTVNRQQISLTTLATTSLCYCLDIFVHYLLLITLQASLHFVLLHYWHLLWEMIKLKASKGSNGG